MILDRSRRAPEQVYDYLRQRILVGDYAPNEPVNERKLTELLGVSRTPIREALRRLADEGLIEVIPSVGSRVSKINLRRVGELARVRIELECLMIRSAVTRITVGQIEDLRHLIETQEQTIVANDFVANIAVDSEFHRLIWSIADNEAAKEILERALNEITRARQLSIRIPGRLAAPIAEHRAILTALESRKIDSCDAAMRKHLDESLDSIVTALELVGETAGA